MHTDYCKLYHNDNLKFETNSSGAKVTGNLEVTLNIEAANSIVANSFSPGDNSAAVTFFQVTNSGNPDTVDGRAYTSVYSTIQTHDAEDLFMELHEDTIFEIKWDNPNAYANDSLSTTDYGRLASFKPQEGVKLFYNDVKKLETTADGVTITGNLIVNGTTTEINSTTLTVDDKNIELGKGTGSVTTGQTATLALNTNVVTVASTVGYLPGAVISNVSGTGAFGSTSPNSCFVKEINSSTEFTIGDGAGSIRNHSAAGAVTFDVGAASDLTANGGGITLKGSTDKTILWTDSTDSWDFNQDIKTSGTVSDSNGDVRILPQTHKAASDHALAVADIGFALSFAPTSDGGNTLTINNNIFSGGEAVTVLNHSDFSLTIAKHANMNLYNPSDGSTPTALAGRGMATFFFYNNANCYVSGAGLS